MLPDESHARPQRVALRKAATFGALGGALLGAGGLLYAREVEPRLVEVNPVTLTLRRLAPEFDGYRLVQMGDLHLDDWAKPAR